MRRGRRVLLPIVFIAACALVAGLVWLDRVRDATSGGDPASSGSQAAFVKLAGASESSYPEVDAPTDPGGQSHVARATPERRMRIIDPEGQGVPDATVWLAFLEEARRTTEIELSDEALQSVDSTAITWMTDKDGYVAPTPGGADRTRGSCAVWILHPDFIAQSLEGKWDERGLVLPDQVRLVRSGRLIVRVVGPDARPVKGARVTERFDFTDPIAHSVSGSALDARRVFLWAATTGEDGSVALVPAPEVLRVQAQGDLLQSPPWVGRSPSRLELKLTATCSVVGRVLCEASPEMTGVQVSALAMRGKDWTTLATIRARTDGSFGPFQVPVIPADQYAVRVRGGMLLCTDKRIPMPATGDVVQADITTTVGHTLIVKTIDSGGLVIDGASIEVQWKDDQGWQALVGKTSQGGEAHLSGAPAGSFWVRGRAHGHVAHLATIFDRSAEATEPIVLRLEKAGTLEGRCIFDGKPVETFTVFLWKDSPNTKIKVKAVGQVDGTFFTDEAPIGDVILYAATETMPRSEFGNVVVRPEETANVELVFGAPQQGSGRVLDARTSEPITNATVQVHTLVGRTSMGKFGAAIPCDEQGQFTISGLVPGPNLVEVSAPGRPSRNVFGLAVPGSVLDFGTIGLYGEQVIDVQLTGLATGDYSPYVIELNGATFVPEQHLPADGHIRFDGLTLSEYHVRVVAPNWDAIYRSVQPEPGRPVSLRIPVVGRSLDVDIDYEDDSVERAAFLGVDFRNALGERTSLYLPVPNDRRVHVTQIDGKEVVLCPVDQQDNTLAVERASLSDKGTDSIRIKIPKARLEILVVDGDRRSLAGATLHIRDADALASWSREEISSDTGILSLPRSLADRLIVGVRHPVYGFRACAPLDATGANPIRLVLDSKAKFTVRAVERGAPRAGVDVGLTDELGFAVETSARTTDATGSTTWERVGAGKYRVAMKHPGYWPAEIVVDHGATDSTRTLEVRRIGNLELVVKNTLGNPQEGALVVLTSVEQNQDVSAWVERGLVTLSQNGWKTGADGRLRVLGLPNGAYRWRVTPRNGEAREGEGTAPPTSTGVVEVRVD